MKTTPSTSCRSRDASVHLDHVEGVLELGAIQPLREEVSLMVCSGCLVDPHVAVVVRLLAGGDLVLSASM